MIKDKDNSDIIVMYGFTEEEVDAITSFPPDEELVEGVKSTFFLRLEKELEKYRYKIGKLYDIFYEYHTNYGLFVEIVEDIIGYFILMEDKRKPATEIEIYAHCKYTEQTGKEESYKFVREHCREIGCANCNYSDKVILDKIFQLKKDIESFGYYTDLRSPFVSFHYDLYATKIKELIEIIKKVPDIHVFPAHAGIRGLIFGYSLEEIAEFMERNEDQVELDGNTADKLIDLISDLIKRGILKENLAHHILIMNPEINTWRDLSTELKE